MNRLEAWQKAGVINLDMPKKAFEEACQGRNSTRTRHASDQTYSDPYPRTQEEEESMYCQTENILFPAGAKNKNQKNDVGIVYNAWCDSTPLITNDGDILGRKHQLKKLGARVMSPSEAVKFIEEQIRERDKDAKIWARETGNPLPSWVGKDLNPETT